MRFDEFKKRTYKANTATVDAFKKKQTLKDKEKKQREWVRKHSNSEVDRKMKTDILASINGLLANSDDKSIKVTTVKTDFV